MIADYTKSFEKMFIKLKNKQQIAAYGAVELFLKDPTSPKLRNHALKGEYKGFRSISAGGDLRLHFMIIDPTRVLFVAVGSHAQLYE